MTENRDVDRVPASSPPASLYIVCGAMIVLFTAIVNLLLFRF
jgi:hypothetical protein